MNISESWEKYLTAHNIEIGCHSCKFYAANSNDGNPECTKYSIFGNSPAFPFQTILPCFLLDFWYTPFADWLRKEGRIDGPIFDVYLLYYQPWRARGASLAELIRWEAEHINRL